MLMFLSMGIVVYAQEIIEQEVMERDVIRLAIKEQQETLYAKTGEYAQIRRDASFEGGLGTELLIMSDTIALADEDYRVDVYTAPCGNGFTIYNFTNEVVWVRGSSTDDLIPVINEKVHQNTTGCLSDVRPSNW